MGNKDIGIRIQEVRKSLGLTLQDIADKVGVARSTVQRYEKGSIDNIKLPVIEAIAKALGVNLDWLMTGRGERLAVRTQLPDNIFPFTPSKLPMVGTIAAGVPIYADEAFDGYVDAGSGIRADFCLKIKGDSMVNARIYDGDIVFIRSQSDVDDGDIAAVLIGNEATLKRVYKKKTGIILMPENPRYTPMVFSGEELGNIRILGKAVAFQSCLN